MAGRRRGDSTAGALPYKRISRSASEPSLLRLVKFNTHVASVLILREAEKKCQTRFMAWKTWRGTEGRRVRTVRLGTWEACTAKAVAGVGRGRSSGEAGNDRGAKGLYL